MLLASFVLLFFFLTRTYHFHSFNKANEFALMKKMSCDKINLADACWLCPKWSSGQHVHHYYSVYRMKLSSYLRFSLAILTLPVMHDSSWKRCLIAHIYYIYHWAIRVLCVWCCGYVRLYNCQHTIVRLVSSVSHSLWLHRKLPKGDYCDKLVILSQFSAGPAAVVYIF